MAAANLVRSTPLGLFVKTGKVFVKLPYSSLFFTLHVGGILDAGMVCMVGMVGRYGRYGR